MLTLTDHDLAMQARRGDPQAFGELVRRYQTAVFNVCYRLAGERREAEELAQEAFLRAYQRLDQYDPERPFGPWVRRVAANLCCNHLEVQSSWTLPLEDETCPAAPAEWIWPEAAGELGDPESLRLQAERAESIRRAIWALPPAYRAVVELRHFQDLSYAETAAALHLPLSAVKSYLFRARRLLAESLKAYA